MWSFDLNQFAQQLNEINLPKTDNRWKSDGQLGKTNKR